MVGFETRLRYIALLMNGVGAFLFYLVYLGIVVLWTYASLVGEPDRRVSAELIWLIGSAAVIGPLIIVAAFRVVAFHLLSGLLLVVAILLAVMLAYGPICLVVLLPQVIYYVGRLIHGWRGGTAASAGPVESTAGNLSDTDNTDRLIPEGH